MTAGDTTIIPFPRSPKSSVSAAREAGSIVMQHDALAAALASSCRIRLGVRAGRGLRKFKRLVMIGPRPRFYASKRPAPYSIADRRQMARFMVALRYAKPVGDFDA